MENILNIFQADIVGIWQTGLRRHLKRGHPRATKSGRDYMIDRADLARFIEDRRQGLPFAEDHGTRLYSEPRERTN